MDSILTLDMVTELPDEIIRISSKYDKQNSLFTKDVLELYDLKTLKDDVEKKFNKYKSWRYISDLPINDVGKITSNYNLGSEIRNKSSISKVDRIISNKIDMQIWIYNFYQTMLITAIKLTRDEATYIVECFLYGEKEESIADNLSVCKQTLQRIKKSSLIKVWLELQNIDD